MLKTWPGQETKGQAPGMRLERVWKRGTEPGIWAAALPSPAGPLEELGTHRWALSSRRAEQSWGGRGPGKWVAGSILVARLLSAPQQRVAVENPSQGNSSPETRRRERLQEVRAGPSPPGSVLTTGGKSIWTPLVLGVERISLERPRIGLLAQ